MALRIGVRRTRKHLPSIVLVAGFLLTVVYAAQTSLSSFALTPGAAPFDVTSAPTSLSASVESEHYCAISAGKAYCWGYNYDGEIGNGTLTHSYIAAAVDTSGVLAGKTVTKVATGAWQSCALADGQVFCWGYNGYGELGNGTTTDSTTPVAVNMSGVLAGKTVTDITAGEDYTCALADGVPYCWGYNADGELGNGTTTDSTTPVAVDTSGVLAGKTITSISSGVYHTCVLASGQPYCWGADWNGELGDNTSTYGTQSSPVAVDVSGVLAGKTVTKVAAGSGYTCAIADGAAYCWGLNSSGQLGDTQTTSPNVPVAVYTSGALSGKTVTDIAVGSDHTCAVASGQAYCWGRSSSGQLGVSGNTNALEPVKVYDSGNLAGKTIVKVSSGYNQSCATTSTNVYCWGNDSKGDLGDDATEFSTTAIGLTTPSVFSGKTLSQLTTNGGTCVLANGQPYCWGANSTGSLGNGGNENSFDPVAVDTTGVLSGKTVSELKAGGIANCAVASGAAYCWGYNNDGELGNGSNTNTNVPVAVDTSGVLSGKTVTHIYPGTYSTCALAGGAPYCWGNNFAGQLGNGSNTDSNVPVAVNVAGVLAGKTVTHMDTEWYSTCAIADGLPYCWGFNNSGQLGNGSTTNSNVPVAVDTSGVLSGKTIAKLGVGGQSACVLTTDNGLYCWGSNYNGQLGNGTNTDSSVPVAVNVSGVLAGKTIDDLAVGSEHVCVFAGGSPYCWGANAGGQLGNGMTTDSNIPVAVNTTGVLAGKSITSITSLRAEMTCVMADGLPYCWGYNFNGELGVRATDPTYKPRTVMSLTGVAQGGGSGNTGGSGGSSGSSQGNTATAPAVDQRVKVQLTNQENSTVTDIPTDPDMVTVDNNNSTGSGRTTMPSKDGKNGNTNVPADDTMRNLGIAASVVVGVTAITGVVVFIRSR